MTDAFAMDVDVDVSELSLVPQHRTSYWSGRRRLSDRYQSEPPPLPFLPPAFERLI